MIVQPKIRGFICTTAHPKGCAQHVQEQIDFVSKQASVSNGPKNVLVIGASTGYGLSSRVVASFGGSKAQTLGIIFEKESDGRRTASAGWYNTVAFEQKANEVGIYAKSYNGDAFSDKTKQNVIKMIQEDMGQVDLVIYSLASPRRQHPKTGVLSKSVLKPIGQTYTNNSMDMSKKILEPVTLQEASQDEIDQTISVMGGEDWEYWINDLQKAGVLADGVKIVAYSYIGPRITQDVYRKGTIGKAKEHLEATAAKLTEALKSCNGRAVVSVNKALVTQSSSAIPFIPLYFVILNAVMKGFKCEEDCISQIYRMFSTRLYFEEGIVVDESGLIRVDDWEMREDVQKEVAMRWENLNQDNLSEYADLDGYDIDFLKLFGFGLQDVDYHEDVEIAIPIPSIK